MKIKITASGVSAKGSPWLAGASEYGGDTVRGILKDAGDRDAKPTPPKKNDVVEVFVEHRAARHVDATATTPARDYPAVTLVYLA